MTFNFVTDLDHYVFQIINGFAGTKTLDYLVTFADSTDSDPLKGGLFLGLYWYFWFKHGPDQPRRRETITAIFIGVIFSLIVCRAIADLAPFRDRPMYADGSGYHHPSVEIRANWENWSSFPSDMAGYFFALSTGALLLSRPLGLILCAHSAVFIGLTRIYLGIHYPGDILVGAGIGMAVVAITAHSRFIRKRLAAPINRLEGRFPGVFYVGLFLMSYEMAGIFTHIRGTFHDVVFALHSI